MDNTLLIGYMLIGCMVSWNILCDDKVLSKKHWLLALIFVAMAWPVFVIAKAYKESR